MITIYLILTSYTIAALILVWIYFSNNKFIHLFLYQSTLLIFHIKLINDDINLLNSDLIQCTCTYTYFNTFSYYKFIHWFLYQSTSTVPYIKLINDDNILLDFDLIPILISKYFSLQIHPLVPLSVNFNNTLYIKLISDDNNLFDSDLIHYSCTYTYVNIFF